MLGWMSVAEVVIRMQYFCGDVTEAYGQPDVFSCGVMVNFTDVR